VALAPLSRAAASPKLAVVEPALACRTSQLQPLNPNAVDGIPVILVHGITASPAAFETSSGPSGSMADQLAGVPGTSVWTFNYHPESLDWVTNPDIAPALATSIDCLARTTSDKVILVDHSMGGLATELAVSFPDASGQPTATHVAEVITLGTPYRGSLLLSLVQGARVVGATQDPEQSAVIEAYLSYCAGRLDDPACPFVGVLDSPDGTALEYDSRAIAALPAWPPDLPVHDVAGNIRLGVGFGTNLSISANIGDGVVTLDSATAHNTLGTPTIVNCHVALTNISLGCWHGALPHNADVVADVVGEVRALVPDLLASEVRSFAPGTSVTLVQVPSGYEAAAYDQSGHLWFFGLAAGRWSLLGRSRYPVLPAAFGPSDTTVTGSVLTGMENATFIARGAYTGDGSGCCVAFTTGTRGWGTVAPGPGDTLVPTGNSSTDNTTPGLELQATFQGGLLQTVVHNPDFDTADGTLFGLVTDWRWDGAEFTDVRDNLFTAQRAAQPNVPAAAALPTHTCPRSPADGAYRAYVTATQSDASVQVLVRQNLPGEGPGVGICTFVASQNVPITVEVRTHTGTEWITAPIWLLIDNYLATGFAGFIGPTLTFPPWDFARGQSPYFLPGALGAVRLVPIDPSEPCLVTIASGTLHSIAF
jgi:hypothetical protein